MQRDPLSHKGQNGKVAVIGGSRFMHGAPILAAKAAEASGVDLVYLMLPDCHANVARTYALNVQVHPFMHDELSPEDVEPILELLATMDAAVIGPGIERESANSGALREIIASASCALVLDAAALQPWTLEEMKNKRCVLTPHLGELEHMNIDQKNIGQAAKKSGCVILLKGHVDRIADTDGTITEIAGGNAGLTVGGTGDTLAGLTAGLIAQGMENAEAARKASGIIKRAGDLLQKSYGYAYGAARVIDQIPRLLRDDQ
jgi:NAD(P)H-hydrate epimerase